MESFVYCWTDNLTHKIYVGKHKGSPDDGYVSSSVYLMEEYRARPEDFSREILGVGSEEDMVSLEKAILMSANAAKDSMFYNMHNGNAIPHGSVKWHSKATKRKLSLAAKKRFEDPEQRKLVSEQAKTRTGKKNSFFGKKHSEESRASMSRTKSAMYIGAGNPNAKSVRYEGKIYPTMKDLEKETGISLYFIRKMIEQKVVEIV